MPRTEAVERSKGRETDFVLMTPLDGLYQAWRKRLPDLDVCGGFSERSCIQATALLLKLPASSAELSSAEGDNVASS